MIENMNGRFTRQAVDYLAMLICHMWCLKWKKIQMLLYSNEEMNRDGRSTELAGLLMTSRPVMLIAGSQGRWVGLL